MYSTAASRPHDAKPFATIALDYLTSYVSDPFHCFENGRCVPLYKGANASRVISLRNHYYGYGEASTPPERAYYVQSGRPSDITTSIQPLRVVVPENGTSGDKPTFGTNAIDAAHAHQLPYWGSMLWQTPEFAFLGHKLWDQTRLYQNFIIAFDPLRWMNREGAWQFLHAVLTWKTASATSDRLYTQAEVLDYVAADFETFSDSYKTSTPGFDHPPTNVIDGGYIDPTLVAFAGVPLFGVMFPIGDGYGQHDFFAGYWVSALGIGEKLGFNATLRTRSAKAGQVLDWIIAQYRKRVVGRINQAPHVNLADLDSYLLMICSDLAITAAGGNVASLVQTYASLATQNGNAPTWDVYVLDGVTRSRDGQGLDQLIAGPSILKNHLHLTGADLDTAQTTVTSWRNQKKTEQQALGVNAGSTWFRYLNAVNNPVLS